MLGIWFLWHWVGGLTLNWRIGGNSLGYALDWQVVSGDWHFAVVLSMDWSRTVMLVRDWWIAVGFLLTSQIGMRS